MGKGRGGIRPAPAAAPPSTAQPSAELCRNWETQRWDGPGPASRGGDWSFAWLRPFLLVNGFLVALAAAVDRLEAAMGPSLLACLAACALRDAPPQSEGAFAECRVSFVGGDARAFATFATGAASIPSGGRTRA